MGPIESWDEGLIGALNLILESRFPMFIAWGEGLHLLHNDAFEAAIVGKGHALGRPLRSVFPETWPRIEPLLQQTLAGQASYHEDVELPLVRNNVLSRTYWSFSYSPVRDTTGEVRGVFAVVHESTRRFLAEEALRASETALRAVTDLAPSLLWRCNPDGALTWVNQGYQRFAGLETPHGAYWDDRVHPDDLEPAQRSFASCLKSGGAFGCQQRLRGVDGEYRWHMVRAQQIVDADGTCLGWYGSATDIHDWRNAIDGLEERDQLFRQFSSVDDTLMWTADVATRRVEALTPECRAVWGMPSDGGSVDWLDWLSGVHEDDRGEAAAFFSGAAAGRVVQAKLRRWSPDGRVRRLHVTAFPMGDVAGRQRRIGGLMVDVTHDLDSRVYLVQGPGHDPQLSRELTRRGFPVRVFRDLAAFQAVASDLLPGCVVLQSNVCENQLLAASAALKLGKGRLPWLAMGCFDLDQAIKFMKLGAVDVLNQSRGVDDLAAAIRSATAALPAEAPKANTGASSAGEARQRLAQLSAREREVLDGLAAGGTNKTIAQQLKLSPRTVETHRAHLMDRLGVRSLAELLMLVAEAGEPSAR